MDRLNTEQLKRTSEILGNVAVAWFTVGVVTPLLAETKGGISFIRPFVLSLIMTTAFFRLSLSLIKGVKND